VTGPGWRERRSACRRAIAAADGCDGRRPPAPHAASRAAGELPTGPAPETAPSFERARPPAWRARDSTGTAPFGAGTAPFPCS